MSKDKEKYHWLNHRFARLLEVRQSYEPAWRDLADHFLPTRYRDVGKNPDAWRKMPLLNDKLVDSTGILAMRTLASGLQGGMTSPTRPWFQLSLTDPTLAAHSHIKEWLAHVTKLMNKLFNGSNFYNAVHTLYGELGTFGTGFMLELADFEHGFRFIPFCAGEYCLDTNDRQMVDVVFRRFQMTARQLAMRFGQENLPSYISSHKAKADDAYLVVHAIYPRTSKHEDSSIARHMPFASVYWLEGHSGVNNSNSGHVHILSESGFQEFPGFGVRWDVVGNDVYGRSPAMDVLPDCRMLQQMGITTLKAIHKAVDPPTAVSASLKSIGLDLTPGGVNYIETAPGQSPQAATPIMEIRPDIQAARSAMQEVQKQIQQGLYNDLFRLLLNSDRSKTTAKEVAVREEEKLILIGPVLDRLHNEFFIPLINRTAHLMWRGNMLPPMPKELVGYDVKIEFVSLLAQAQKMVATSAVDKLMHFVSTITPLQSNIADAIDADKAVDEYADYLGIAPSILRPQDERDQLRHEREQATRAVEQAKLEQDAQNHGIKNLQEVSKVVKNLSETELKSDSPMGAIVHNVWGAT